MTSKIIYKNINKIIIEWQDDKKGFGQLKMTWIPELGRYILDSEMMGIGTVIDIFKSIKNGYEGI